MSSWNTPPHPASPKVAVTGSCNRIPLLHPGVIGRIDKYRGTFFLFNISPKNAEKEIWGKILINTGTGPKTTLFP